MKRELPRRLRPRLWTWCKIHDMYCQQHPDTPREDLEQRAHEFTRQLNNLNNRTQYDQWRFSAHEYTRGLSVSRNDTYEHE